MSPNPRSFCLLASMPSNIFDLELRVFDAKLLISIRSIVLWHCVCVHMMRACISNCEPNRNRLLYVLTTSIKSTHLMFKWNSNGSFHVHENARKIKCRLCVAHAKRNLRDAKKVSNVNAEQINGNVKEQKTREKEAENRWILWNVTQSRKSFRKMSHRNKSNNNVKMVFSWSSRG